jgi:hypothetical protein
MSRRRIDRLPNLPTKIRVVCTAYNRRAGVYQTIPGAAASCVVNTPSELKRLFDQIWRVIEEGKWFDESNRPAEQGSVAGVSDEGDRGV